jgi:hypothetical protein
MKKIYLAALLGMLVGCGPTEYRKGDSGVGFFDTQLAENVFEVSFQGGDASEAHRVRDFAMLRASEVTLEHGFSYFKILGEDDQTEHVSFTTGGYTTSYYNAVTNTTETSTTPVIAGTSTVLNPTKRIMCFKKKPEGVFVYDAKFVSKSIRESYGIIP